MNQTPSPGRRVLWATLLSLCSASCSSSSPVGDRGPRADGRRDFWPPEVEKTCRRQCASASECCSKPPCATWPDRYSCDQGFCRALGCAGDSDCKGLGSTYQCFTVDSVQVCGERCTTDVSCTGFTGEKCINGSYCASASPAKTPTCSATQSCPSTSALVSRCYLATGLCGCDTDDACQRELGTEGGIWRCVE
jgi:hypothetical protein